MYEELIQGFYSINWKDIAGFYLAIIWIMFSPKLFFKLKLPWYCMSILLAILYVNIVIDDLLAATLGMISIVLILKVFVWMFTDPVKEFLEYQKDREKKKIEEMAKQPIFPCNIKCVNAWHRISSRPTPPNRLLDYYKKELIR